MYAESDLQESARRFTPSALCLVLDFACRLWAGLGLLGFGLRFSLVGCRPLALKYSVACVPSVGDAWVGAASSCLVIFELY
jgi:hypothetical protein